MHQKIVSGINEDEIWQQVQADLKEHSELFQYNVILEQGGKQVALIIDVDLGGGFESGYATTQFIAPLPVTDFQLTIHKQGFFQEAGKLFGLQDIAIGNPAVDKKFIIRSNDEEKVKAIFRDEQLNDAILSLDDASINVASKENTDGSKSSYMDLTIEDGITDVQRLREIYTAIVRLRDRITEAHKT